MLHLRGRHDRVFVHHILKWNLIFNLRGEANMDDQQFCILVGKAYSRVSYLPFINTISHCCFLVHALIDAVLKSMRVQ